MGACELHYNRVCWAIGEATQAEDTKAEAARLPHVRQAVREHETADEAHGEKVQNALAGEIEVQAMLGTEAAQAIQGDDV